MPEQVTISTEEYKKMQEAVRKLKELEKIDWNLVHQFKQGLEDLKHGRVRKVA